MRLVDTVGIVDPSMDTPRTRASNRRKHQQEREEHHSIKKQEEEGGSAPIVEETADDEELSTLDIGACCLCHCSLDYSDKAAFSKEARFEDYNDDEGSADSYYFRKQDPYLPIALEDSNNALIYCDSCPRLYHQQCHFVPVIHLQANKPWECLVCTVQKQEQHLSAQRSKKKIKAEPYPYDIMFRSPPIPSARPHEIRWECDPRVIAMKAILCDREINIKLPKMFSNTITKYKRAITALNAIASIKRNRDHFLTKSSQELVQSVVTVTAAKRRIRAIFQDLEHVRCAGYPRMQWGILLSWVQQQTHGDFISRTIFPFGTEHARRWAPVTPEYKPEESFAPVPSQITIPKPDTPTRRSTRSSFKLLECKPVAKDDGSFSLDELTCCVCLNGESSDENDMILCDGHKCFRAYHTQCVHPAIAKEVLEDEDANWFCPFCQSLANSLHTIQGLTADADEWEQRREARRANEDHEGSLASWGGPEDVFPEADREHRVALRLKQGERDHHTKALLMKMLDMEEDVKEIDAQVENDDDDDNVEEDGHFDMYSYKEERKRKKEEASELTSDNSSQATLQELSSVELTIDKDELAALKVEGASSRDEEESSNNGIGRRLRPRNAPNDSDSNIDEDPGKMSAKNILNGKRKRRQVDYRKLNDVIFGDTDEKEQLKLDDGEDFVSTLKAGQVQDESSCSDDSQ